MTTAIRISARSTCATAAWCAPSWRLRCGYRGTISRLLAARLERPLPANAHRLSHVLHVAAAQILFLDIPDSAAVDLAVTHAKSDPRTAASPVWSTASCAACPRQGQRAPAELAKGDEAPAGSATASPPPMARKALAILAAHRIEAPIDLTVKSDR